MHGERIRHLGVKCLSEHAQGSNPARHPWLPEFLSQIGANMWQGSLDHLLAAAWLDGSKGCAHGVGFIGIHEIDPLGSPGFEQVFHRQGGAREPFGVVNQNVILLNAQHHNIVIRAEQIRMGIVLCRYISRDGPTRRYLLASIHLRITSCAWMSVL